MGAGGTAATVVLSSTETYDKQTGFNYEQVVKNGSMDRDQRRILTQQSFSETQQAKQKAEVERKERKAERANRRTATRTCFPAAKTKTILIPTRRE